MKSPISKKMLGGISNSDLAIMLQKSDQIVENSFLQRFSHRKLDKVKLLENAFRSQFYS